MHCVQGVKLSRETINNVLERNNQNGYQSEFKRWKFFRAKEPDELWQIDFKGPFSVGGKSYYFLICIDDYSRFIVCAEQFDHQLTTAETVTVLEKQKRRPKAILSDHGPQFRINGRAGAMLMGLKRILLILLTLRTRAKLSGAFKISTESLSIA